MMVGSVSAGCVLISEFGSLISEVELRYVVLLCVFELHILNFENTRCVCCIVGVRIWTVGSWVVSFGVYIVGLLLSFRISDMFGSWVCELWWWVVGLRL